MEKHFDPRFYYSSAFTALKQCLSWALELPGPFLFLLTLDPQERMVFSTSFSGYRFVRDGMTDLEGTLGSIYHFHADGKTRGEHLSKDTQLVAKPFTSTHRYGGVQWL